MPDSGLIRQGDHASADGTGASVRAPSAAGFPLLVEFRLPGMLHACVVHAPGGAHLCEPPATPRLPGFVRLVTREHFVAVVCRSALQAMKAAKSLDVQWSPIAPPPATTVPQLFASLRNGRANAHKRSVQTGDVATALAAADLRLEAKYVHALPSPAGNQPACAVAYVSAGEAAIWCGSQQPQALRMAIAAQLGLAVDRVRIHWLPGPSSFGARDADDAAMDAAVLSQELERPVRVQYQLVKLARKRKTDRAPLTLRMRGGLDAHGKVVAFDLDVFGYSARHAAQVNGAASFAGENYQFPHQRKTSNLLNIALSPTEHAHAAASRDAETSAMQFASESFIDELAFAAGKDPLEFRCSHLAVAHERAVLTAAAHCAGWHDHGLPEITLAGPLARGRGIAFVAHAGAVIALVAHIEIHLGSGRFRVTRFVAAHDSGMIVNPIGLTDTIEAQLIDAMQHAMTSGVHLAQGDAHGAAATDIRGDTQTVIANDLSLDAMHTLPDAIDIVSLNSSFRAAPQNPQDLPAPLHWPVEAVIANALFDATGVRIRRVPFSTASLQAALLVRAPATRNDAQD